MPWNPCGAPGLSSEPRLWDGLQCVELPWELTTDDVIPVQPGDKELAHAHTTSAAFWYRNRGHTDVIPIHVLRTVHGRIQGLFLIEDNTPSSTAEAVRLASTPFSGYWDVVSASTSTMEDVNGETCIAIPWKRGIPTGLKDQLAYCLMIACGSFIYDEELYPEAHPRSVSIYRGSVTGWFSVNGPRVDWLEEKPLKWYFTNHNTMDVFLVLSHPYTTTLPVRHYMAAAARTNAHIGDPRSDPYEPVTHSIVVSPPRNIELRRLSVDTERLIVGQWTIPVLSPALTWTCMGYYMYPYKPKTIVLQYHAQPPSNVGPSYTPSMLLEQTMRQEQVEPPDDPAIVNKNQSQSLIWGRLLDDGTNGVMGSVLMRVTSIPQNIPCLANDHQMQITDTRYDRHGVAIIVIVTILILLAS
jgi:hypothetical protein